MAHKARILIADDEKLMRTLLTDTLESSGYAVIPALDGEEALLKARLERPDLILLDIVMPKRNGILVAQTLKGDPDTKAIPIIILSSLAGPSAAQVSGAEAYLQKPVKDQDLLRHVARNLPTRGETLNPPTPRKPMPVQERG